MRTEHSWDFIPPEQHFKDVESMIATFQCYSTIGLEDWELNSPFTPPNDKFELVAIDYSSRDPLYLWPTTLSSAYLFRGQGAFYYPCLPTLYRKKRTAIDLFINQIRIEEFTLMLQQYPQVQYFKDRNLNIDYVGLAQHYGIDTDVLDLTSSIEVALFFAMCDYDSASGGYKPKEDSSATYIGYLYAYPFILTLMGGSEKEERNNFEKIKPIGLQPFSRPGAQRGFSIHLSSTHGFISPVYSFSYRSEDSQRIYAKYRDIFVEDELSKKARAIAASDTLYVDAIKVACARSSKTILGRELTYNQAREILKERSFKLTTEPMWQLSKEREAVLHKEFVGRGIQELQASICSRKLMSDNRTYPYVNLDIIIKSESLKFFKKGCKSLPGYNSGVSLCYNNDNKVCGIGYSYGREQTIPNPVTHKVDKWDNLDWSQYELPNSANRFQGRFPKEKIVIVPKDYGAIE